MIDSEKECKYSLGSVGAEKKGSIKLEDINKVLMINGLNN